MTNKLGLLPIANGYDEVKQGDRTLTGVGISTLERESIDFRFSIFDFRF
ncbi:hypothetical protein [Microcoleus sp. B9-D4]